LRKDNDGVLTSPTIGISVRPKLENARKREALAMSRDEQDLNYREEFTYQGKDDKILYRIRDVVPSRGGIKSPYARYEVWTNDSPAKRVKYFREWKENAERRLRNKKSEVEKIMAVVRYDQATKWEDISQLLEQLEAAGFKRIQYRVLSKSKQ
jgi:hypothetical protein